MSHHSSDKMLPSTRLASLASQAKSLVGVQVKYSRRVGGEFGANTPLMLGICIGTPRPN